MKNITPEFCLVFSEAYLQLYEAKNMKSFAKIDDEWIQSNIFLEKASS